MGAHPRDRRAHDDAARPRAPRPVPRRLATRLGRHRAALRLLCGRERHRHLPAPRPAQRRLEPARGGRGDRRRGQGVPRRASSSAPAARGRSTRSSSARSSCPRSARRASSSTIRPTRCCRTSPRSSSSGSARRRACPSASSSRVPPGRGCSTRSSRRGSAPTSSRPPIYPLALTLHRVSGRVARRRAPRARPRDGRRHRAAVGGLRPRRRAHRRRSPSHPWRRASPFALPSTTCPPASSPRSTSICARTRPAIACSTRSPRSCSIRAESGWPPLASPIGQILASQALLNVLSARRYGTVLDEFRMLVEGAYGTTPAPIEESVSRAVALVTGSGGGLDEDPPSAEDVREAAEGLAASEEDLVLLAMFGQEAETLLQSIRQRHSRETSLLLGRRRRDARRADPRARQDRAGVRRRRDRDRGRRACASRSGGPTRPAQSRRAARGDPRRRATPSSRSRRPRDDARRVADGRRLLPLVLAREPRVRRGRRRRHASARRCACSRR